MADGVLLLFLRLEGLPEKQRAPRLARRSPLQAWDRLESHALGGQGGLLWLMVGEELCLWGSRDYDPMSKSES
jgi:hypothetical protein